ncbi:MAG: ectoine/hydroxyectoine ABC transporter permease subunit EhuD [Candidatus Dormibacteria bacterium]
MDLTYLEQVAPQLLDGLRITIEATVLGMAVASAVGLLVAIGRRARVPILSRLLDLYVVFVRNTPLLIQLYFLYYVLPNYGVRLDAFTIGVLGLGVQFSAYTSEVYRAGLASVPVGQWEAAKALHFSTSQTLLLVVVPQAIRPVIPALGNYLISMFKDSSYLATITVYELLGTTRELASLSFQYVLLFSTMGLIYLALSYAASRLVRRLERRIGGSAQ